MKTNRISKLRKCGVETLESRRVLAAMVDPMMHFGQLTPSQWAEQVADNIGFMPVALDGTELQRFSSEEDAVSTLSGWAADNWEGLFGQELTRELWEQNAWRQDPLFFPTEWIEDSAPMDWLQVAPAFPTRIASFNFSTLEVRDTTNRRLANIDDADIVEFSDDGYLFVNHRQRLRIIDARDMSDLVEVGSIALSHHSSRILLSGNHLVVASSPGWSGADTASEIRVYDVTNKNAPLLTSMFEFDGDLRTTRLAGGRLTLEIQSQVDLPKPILILADGVEDTPQRLSQTPVGRFETRDEYMARIGASIVSMVLPDYSISTEGIASALSDIGDWQDVVSLRDGLSRIQTAVVNIGLDRESPELLDSEVALGVNAAFLHVTENTAYAVGQASGWARPFVFPTMPLSQTSEVLRFDLLQTGEIVAVAAGEVEGFIRDERMIDEFDGDLRVAVTETGEWGIPGNSASIYVLRPDGGKLLTIGALEDIAPGQALLGAYFSGPSAVVTTAEMVGFLPIRDPLHSIDLSDPSNPIELDELEIPGATTHLQWISNEFLIGVGSSQTEDGSWRDQVSLYDVSDPLNLRVAHSWTGITRRMPTFGNQAPDALAVHFDAATQTLIVPFGRFASGPNNMSWDIIEPGAELFRISTDSSEPLQHLGSVHVGDQVNRAFVVEDKVVSVGSESIQIIELDDLESVLSELSLRNPLVADYYRLPLEGTKILSVLENDRLDPSARIVGVSGSNLGASISITEDGRQLIYDAAEASGDLVDSFTYTVETSTGIRNTASVVVNLWQPINETNDTKVMLSVVAVDDAGRAVSELKPGDRVWIELAAESDGASDSGIYQVVFDVSLDRNLFEIVAPPEPLGKFTNQFSFIESIYGFSEIGGFADSFTPIGGGKQRIARFQVEVMNPDDSQVHNSRIEVRATEASGREVLVYDSDFPVAHENVTPARMNLTVSTLGSSTDSEDINGDGLVSALDALTIVNFLNREARQMRVLSLGEAEVASSSMDVNRDGLVSAADVLSIVNRINRENDIAAEGELQADAEVMVDDDWTLTMLAAEQSFAWDLERRERR